jgi:hypothetical protein
MHGEHGPPLDTALAVDRDLGRRDGVSTKNGIEALEVGRIGLNPL